MVFLGNLSAIEMCSFGSLEIRCNGMWRMVPEPVLSKVLCVDGLFRIPKFRVNVTKRAKDEPTKKEFQTGRRGKGRCHRLTTSCPGSREAREFIVWLFLRVSLMRNGQKSLGYGEETLLKKFAI